MDTLNLEQHTAITRIPCQMDCFKATYMQSDKVALQMDISPHGLI